MTENYEEEKYFDRTLKVLTMDALK